MDNKYNTRHRKKNIIYYSDSSEEEIVQKTKEKDDDDDFKMDVEDSSDSEQKIAKKKIVKKIELNHNNNSQNFNIKFSVPDLAKKYILFGVIIEVKRSFEIGQDSLILWRICPDESIQKFIPQKIDGKIKFQSSRYVSIFLFTKL